MATDYIYSMPRPEEISLVGRWKFDGVNINADETNLRIDWLVENHLQHIATSSDGWEKLFRDPRDERLWELTYPESHLHGGGPPSLQVVDSTETSRQYRQN